MIGFPLKARGSCARATKSLCGTKIEPWDATPQPRSSSTPVDNYNYGAKTPPGKSFFVFSTRLSPVGVIDGDSGGLETEITR